MTDWLPPDWEDRPFDLCGRYPKKTHRDFQESLADWTDPDIAQYELGLALGMFPPGATFSTDLKWVFWSDNPIGNFLNAGIVMLHHLGDLEFSEEHQWRTAR